MPQGRKLIAENRKARHDFHILERVEAGVALTGTEVKSLRDGGGNLREATPSSATARCSWSARNIAPYRQGNMQNHEPLRERKLLLHRREIEQLGKKVAERGMTLVPLALYFSDGQVKVELGLAKGKEGVDKRRTIADRDARRADRAGPARAAAALAGAMRVELGELPKGANWFRHGWLSGRVASRGSRWPRKIPGKPQVRNLISHSPPSH